jgi:ABC-type amino acid transport substrate-binding protein
MRRAAVIQSTVAASLALLAAAPDCRAAEPCAPVRIAYTDRHAPPYFFGAGETVPGRPGAAVELIRKMVGSAGCPIAFVRIPVARIRVALADGSVDMAPLNATPNDTEIAAVPQDGQGRLDPRRSIEASTYVFVRSADNVPAGVDTAAHFKGKRLGMMQGIAYTAQLRSEGYQIDAGATDLDRNIEKLLLGRVDGYAATVTTPSDLDAVLRARYGDKVRRLERPIRVSRLYLAASRQYYAAHPARVDAMWDWVAAHGRSQLTTLIREYERLP